MSGTQISDMTDSLTDFPDGAFVPFVVETPIAGLSPADNYRYNLGRFVESSTALAGVPPFSDNLGNFTTQLIDEDTSIKEALESAGTNLLATTAGKGDALVGSDDGQGGTLWTTIRGFISYLLSSAGSSIVGFLQSGTGAVSRTVQSKNRDIISVKDFGAVGDGIADDTAAIQKAIDLVTFVNGTPANVSQTGMTLYFPRGIYLVDDLQVLNTASTNNSGLNGLNIVGDQAVLKGLPGATRIMFIGTGITSNNISDVKLSNLQFDLTAMTTPGVGTIGLELANAYRCILQNLVFYGGPADNTHMQFSHTGSQISLYNCHGARIRIEGDDYGVAQLVLTTMSFYGCSWVDLLADRAWGLGFWGCICHDPAVAAFKLSNCDTICIFGGDYEGEAIVNPNRVFLDCTGGNVTGIREYSARPLSLPNYILGHAAASYFGSMQGFFNTANAAAGARTVVSTTAVPIFSFVGDPVAGSGKTQSWATIYIYCEGGGQSWRDQVIVANNGVVKLVDSVEIYGGAPPGVMTYDLPTTSLRAVASSGSYQVKAVATSSPFN